MPSTTRALLLLICCNLFASISSASDLENTDNAQQFRQLLDVLPTEYLHSALQQNLASKFREGVWEHAKRAMEAVHRDNPPLASRVLADAALELVKRQNLNGTTTNPPVVASPTTTPNQQTSTGPASSSQAVVVPIVVSTTNSRGSSVVTTSSVVASATLSLASTVTTTDAAGSTTVSATTEPAAVIVSDGLTMTAAVSRFVQTALTTDENGSVFVTTFTPDASNINSLVLITTTLPNGVRSTITSFAAMRTTAQVQQTATTAGPRLQGAAGGKAKPIGIRNLALALGVVFGLMALL